VELKEVEVSRKFNDLEIFSKSIEYYLFLLKLSKSIKLSNFFILYIIKLLKI